MCEKDLAELGIHVIEDREVGECDLCGKIAELSKCKHGETEVMVCDDCADYCSSVNYEDSRPIRKPAKRGNK